jgi:hypothetical protein
VSLVAGKSKGGTPSLLRVDVVLCAVECLQPGCRAHRENRDEHICEACPAILSLLEWPLKVLGFAPSVPSTHQAESDLEAAVSATPDGTWTQTSRVLPAHQARFPQVTLQEQIKDIVIILPCAQRGIVEDMCYERRQSSRLIWSTRPDLTFSFSAQQVLTVSW